MYTVHYVIYVLLFLHCTEINRQTATEIERWGEIERQIEGGSKLKLVIEG